MNLSANNKDQGGEFENSKQIQVNEEVREYQRILSDIAIKENAIVCLPTGSGKTFVAVSVIQEFLKIARRDNKKIVFLANKVHLVHQQGKYIEQRVGVGENDFVAIITGDMNTDEWKHKEWDQVSKNSYVMVISTEIFKQALFAAYLKWSNVALLILDECHHATKKDPMSLVIDNYYEKYNDPNFPKKDLPRILGLTATIINDGGSNIDCIPRDIHMIEHKFCGRVVTHTNPDELKGYSTSARVEIKHFGSGLLLVKMDIEKYTLCLEKAKEDLGKIRSLNNKPYQQGAITHASFKPENLFYSGKVKGKIYTALLEDVILAFKELGAYCARYVAKSNLVFLQTTLMGCTWHTNDEQQGGKIVSMALEKFIQDLDKEFKHIPRDFVLATYISRKLDELVKILKRWRQGLAENSKSSTRDTQDSEMCGIVFVKKRCTAQTLNWYFQDAKKYNPQEFGLLSTDFVVGCENSHWGMNPENMHFTSIRQTKVLTAFRENKINLIFSTSVLEEGLDVRNCGLGIRFDPIENYPSFVQSMGRVRQQNAPFYVMVDLNEREKETKRLYKFKTYHEALQKYMVKKSILPEDYDNEAKKEILGACLKSDNGIKPFCPGGTSDSPKVTLDTAIQLVYRYCAALPCDRLSPLYPYSWSEKLGENVFKAYLQFPSNSVITDVVEGPIVKGKQIAKQAVHLAACKLLYEREALDDHLEPIATQVPIAANEFMDTHQNQVKAEEAFAPGKVGTQKRTQWYPKSGPSLSGIYRDAEQIIYLITFTKNNKNQVVDDVYNFEGKHFAFGLLTGWPIGHLPQFSLFGNFGDSETMSVQLNEIKIRGHQFTQEQIEHLKSMQNMIFGQLLRMANPLFCQSDVTLTPLIVVPLNGANGDYDVLWDFKEKIEALYSHEFLQNPPAFMNKSNKVFDPKIYADTVVMTCCKNKYETIKSTDLFCVTGFDYKETSNSPMGPQPGSKTYVAHYLEKFTCLGIQILNPTFPVLRTKQLGKNLNFLSTKRRKNDKKRIVEKHNRAAFPPDVVFICPIPASLLAQATLLPSILQRIFRMLQSREILMSIGKSFPDWLNSPVQNCGISHVSPDMNTSVSNFLPEDSISSAEEEEPMEFEDGEIKIEVEDTTSGSNLTISDLNAPIAQEYIHPDDMTPELIDKFKSLAGKKTKTARSTLNRYKRKYELSSVDSLAKKLKPLDSPNNLASINIVSPCPFDVMEALTLANAEDSLSMERLEFIGDSVLKLFCSLHIFFHFPNSNEGQMTNLRNILVSNAYLYLRAKDKNLGEYISGGIFQPDKTWIYPGATLFPRIGEVAANNGVNLDCFAEIPLEKLRICSMDELDSKAKDWISTNEKAKVDNNTFSHTRIGDKNIADCVESLIGSYYARGGLPGALRFMKWMDLRAPTQNGQIINYGEIPLAAAAATATTNRNVDVDVAQILIGVNELEDLISYKFKNRLLVLEAFSYPDYTKNMATGCYQRLEFLGDAVLDFLIANHIYSEGKGRTPGDLTNLKSALVNNFTLASLTVKYGLEKNLLSSGSKVFQDAIDNFVGYQEQNGDKITGILPLKQQSEWKDPNIAECMSVPKVLGDIFESLVGAVYIDSGRSLDTTWKIVYRLMEQEITKFSQKIPRNVVAILNEKYPSEHDRLIFTVEENTKQNAIVTSTVVKLTVPGISEDFFARGVNKKEAKQAVALWALKQITSGKAKRTVV